MEKPSIMYIIRVAKSEADIYYLREDRKFRSPRSFLLPNLFGFPEIPKLWLTSLNKAADVRSRGREVKESQKKHKGRRQMSDMHDKTRSLSE